MESELTKLVERGQPWLNDNEPEELVSDTAVADEALSDVALKWRASFWRTTLKVTCLWGDGCHSKGMS